MAIFNSYVKLPEGTLNNQRVNQQEIPNSFVAIHGIRTVRSRQIRQNTSSSHGNPHEKSHGKSRSINMKSQQKKL